MSINSGSTVGRGTLLTISDVANMEFSTQNWKTGMLGEEDDRRRHAVSIKCRIYTYYQ